MSQPPLVLASSSPRRQGLLSVLGVSFTVDPPDVDESQRPGEPPTDFVERVARAKSQAGHHPGTASLGADTIVSLGGRVLLKPSSTEDAAEMLRSLSGVTHRVHTGVALTTDDGTRSVVCTTAVTMSHLDDETIATYVETGEPMDKAGAYALQGVGGAFVERVDGDPFNVIGLPLAVTRALFAVAGLDLLAYRTA